LPFARRRACADVSDHDSLAMLCHGRK